jgi:hypothetical protein
MPWNGSGSYTLPTLYSPEANGTTIDALRYNGLTSDVATGISFSLAKDGQNVPTANLPMGGHKHTGVNSGVASGEYLAFGQSVAELRSITFNGYTTADSITDIRIQRSGSEISTIFRGACLALANTTTSSGVLAQNFLGSLQIFTNTGPGWNNVANISAAGAYLASDGTALAPSLSFKDHTGSGFYYDTANTRTIFATSTQDRVIIDIANVTVNGASTSIVGSFPFNVIANSGNLYSMGIYNNTGTKYLAIGADVGGTSTVLLGNYNNDFRISTIDSTNDAIRVYANSRNVDLRGGVSVGITVQNTNTGTVFLPSITVPGANPATGGLLWVEAGALKYRGSSGTVTTIAPA